MVDPRLCCCKLCCVALPQVKILVEVASASVAAKDAWGRLPIDDAELVCASGILLRRNVSQLCVFFALIGPLAVCLE